MTYLQTARMKLNKAIKGSRQQFSLDDFNTTLDRIDTLAGYFPVANAAARPTDDLYNGRTIYQLDNKQIYVWNATLATPAWELASNTQAPPAAEEFKAYFAHYKVLSTTGAADSSQVIVQWADFYSKGSADQLGVTYSGGTTRRWTCTKAGVYSFTVDGVFTNSTAAQFFFNFRKNGTVVDSRLGKVSTFMTFTLSFDLAVGDYVDLTISGNANNTVQPDTLYMAVRRLGA